MILPEAYSGYHFHKLSGSARSLDSSARSTGSELRSLTIRSTCVKSRAHQSCPLGLCLILGRLGRQQMQRLPIPSWLHATSPTCLSLMTSFLRFRSPTHVCTIKPLMCPSQTLSLIAGAWLNASASPYHSRSPFSRLHRFYTMVRT